MAPWERFLTWFGTIFFMPTVILVAVDLYDGPGSKLIDAVHVVPVVPVEVQRDVKGNAC